MSCEKCAPDDPVAAYAWSLDVRTVLVDDSHFIVSVRTCPACRQVYVRVFAEFVDFANGEDAQHIDQFAVTEAEAAALERGPVGVAELTALASGRRRLVSDWPSDAGRRVCWADGPAWLREGH